MIVLKLCQTKLCMTRQLCKWNWNCITINPVTQAAKSIIENGSGNSIKDLDSKDWESEDTKSWGRCVALQQCYKPKFSFVCHLLHTEGVTYNKQHHFKLSSDFLRNLLSVLQSQTCTHKSEIVLGLVKKECEIAQSGMKTMCPLIVYSNANCTITAPTAIYVWAQIIDTSCLLVVVCLLIFS